MQNYSLGIGRFVKLIIAFVVAMPVFAAHKPVPPSAEESFKASVLEVHNAERVRLGSVPLQWDEALATDAANWASSLASKEEFEHAFAELAQKKQGENLALGRTGFFSIEQLVELWLDERSMTKTGIFPDVTTTGNWSDVGHYTQMIWPTTKKIGCAVRQGKSDDYLVCRYWPAGNRIGDKLQVNVPN